MSTGTENPDRSGLPAVRPVDLLMVWRTLRKHWPTALATAIAVSLIAVFYTLGQTKIYQASATIMFDPNPPRPLGKDVEGVIEFGNGTYWNNREYYETQYKIIQSKQVTLAVVKQLGLNRDGAFLKNLPSDGGGPQMEVPVEAAAAVLQARIKVDPVKDSRLAYVRLEDASPSRAQRILAVVTETYMDQNMEYATSSTTSAVAWLRQQVDKLRNELEDSERALHKYKRDKNILSLDLDAQSNMLREEMSQLNIQLTSVRARREAIAAQSAELHKVPTDDPSTLPAQQLLSSPLIQRLRDNYDGAVRDRAALVGSGKGSSHPDVAAAEARVATANKALLSEIRNVQRAVERELATVKKEEAGLSKLFESSKRRALELNLLEVDYNRLRRSRDNNEKLYSLVLERTKESDLAGMARVNNIRMVERAEAGGGAIRPRVPVNIGVGVFFGIALGIAAALGRALLDRTVKTPDDVEQDLGAVFLGLLPEKGTKGAYRSGYGKRRRKRRPEVTDTDLEVHENPSSGFSEAARAVRTNLMFMAPDKPYRTVLVTSPAPSEGKTTVAVSIAIAMAQAGQRVALLDCDLRRPRVHRVFRTSYDVGVTTAVIESGPVEAFAQATDVPNLSIIPAGPIPPNPAELFHSEKFAAFLRQVTQTYDRVVIDSPPVVTVTDAAVLSTLVDGVVLVVRAYATQREFARHAIRAVRDVGGKLIGVVLNAVNLDRHEYKYHYYYYRRDDYAYGPRAEDRKRPPDPPDASATVQ